MEIGALGFLFRWFLWYILKMTLVVVLVNIQSSHFQVKTMRHYQKNTLYTIACSHDASFLGVNKIILLDGDGGFSVLFILLPQLEKGQL